MAVQYSKPGRFNLVSFLFLLAGLAAVYSLFKFSPPYYRRWKAAAVVSDMANKLYGERMRGDTTAALRQELLARLRDLGIDDTTVQADFQASPTRARLGVSYQEVVTHPFVRKTTTLRFDLGEEVTRSQD